CLRPRQRDSGGRKTGRPWRSRPVRLLQSQPGKPRRTPPLARAEALLSLLALAGAADWAAVPTGWDLVRVLRPPKVSGTEKRSTSNVQLLTFKAERCTDSTFLLER